jgi:hypothetical protein
MFCSTTEALRTALNRTGRLRIRKRKAPILYTITHSASQLDSAAWQSLVADGSAFLQLPYLKSLENGCQEHMEFVYATFFQHNKVCGVAVFQLAKFDAANVSTNVASDKPIVSWITRSLTPTLNENSILICGNAFATGEHGFVFSPGTNELQAMDALCYCLTEVLKQKKAQGKKIVGVLIKDFYTKNFSKAESLENCGFKAFNVDRNMIMPIDSAWQSFEDYLGAMVTKFRTKANAAMARSEMLVVKNMNAQDILAHEMRVDELYQNVHNKADFKIGALTAKAMAELCIGLGDKFRFYGYFLNEHLVGFRTTLVGQQCMDAHVVGLDYTLNKDIALYSRMLYDYVDEAIQLRASHIVFGRTAGEIKSTVGALPVDLQCCIRHPGKISNFVLSCIFSYVQPSEFPVRKPYKKEVQQAMETLVDNG